MRILSCRTARWLVALPLLTLAAGCGEEKSAALPRKPTPPDALAVVDGEAITAEDYRAEAARRNVPGGNAAAGRALLDEMVENLRLLQYARKKGYESDPAIARQYRLLLIERARADLLPANDDAGRQTVGNDEVAAYYEAHKAEYAIPARVRAAMIFVAIPPGMNPETRAARRRKIEEARAAVLAAALPPDAAFGGLAATYSEHQESRYIGGDLGYQAEGMTNFSADPAVVEGLFALKTAGQLSEIIPGADGLYFFKLLEANPAATLPLAKVEGRVRSALYSTQRADAQKKMAAVLAAIPAEIHPEKLDGVAITGARGADPAAGLPPRVPGQTDPDPPAR